MNAATKPAASSWPRSDSAASASPAAQPSVRAASAATDASGKAGTACWSSFPASAGVNRSSATRISVSWPRARSRASASGGSLRLASTTQIPAGRCSTRNESDSCTGGALITW